MDRSHTPAWMVVGAGIVALAAAMGIGRFAFTPLLPLMLRDGTLATGAGAEWAAANYAGYLAGAMTASWFSADPRRGLAISLLGVGLTTLAAAWVGAGIPGWGGAVLRAASGVFSAWTLVCASAWGLAELARRGAGRLGAWIYTGVGLGIALAGVLAWLGGRQPASRLWLELGLLALAGAGFVMAGVRGSLPVAAAAAPGAPGGGRRFGLVISYGTFGFGYIVPATFLPAMARELVDDPLVFGLTWPLFGLAAALSVAAAARWAADWPRRRVWALAQGVMALGTLLPLVNRSLGALATSAVLVGGTFMVATMAGLQLARAEEPANPTPLLARMTMAFAVGQILGPVLVRLAALAELDAIMVANAVATVLLAATAVWLWRPAG